MAHIADHRPEDAPARGRSALGWTIPVIAIILFGYALRLYHLDADALWFDEIGQAAVGMFDVKTAVFGASLHNGAAPADYLLTWLALRIAHNDFIVRLPAVINGTLALALIYQLGRVLFGRATGVMAALLLAAAPLHLRYSQEVRFYALFTCVSIAATLALVLALQRSNWRHWSAYTVLLILGLYTHYFMPLVAVVQGLTVAAVAFFPRQFSLTSRPPSPAPTVRWRTLAAFAASCTIAAVAFLPWVFAAVVHETGMPRSRPPGISLAFAQRILTGLVLGQGAQFSQYYQALPLWLPWLYLSLAVAGSLAGFARLRTRVGALFATGSVLLLPYLANLMIHGINYFFAIRQVLFVLPAFLLLTSFGVASLVGLVSRRVPAPAWRSRLAVGLALAIALVLLLPLRPAAKLAYTGHRLELLRGWKEAQAFLDANATPQDGVLSSFPRYYLYYYSPQRADPVLNAEMDKDLKPLVGAHPTGWLLTHRLDDISSIPEDVTLVTFAFSPDTRLVYWYPKQDGQAYSSRIQSWTLPDVSSALVTLAEELATAGAEARAVESFSKAEAVAEDDIALREVMVSEGSLWRKLGNRPRAIETYRRIVQRWPTASESWIRLGESLFYTDQLDAASEALQRGLQLKPDHYWGHLILGQVRLRQGAYQHAVESFRTAISLEPDEAVPYDLLGDSLVALDDSTAAVAAYERFLELDPSSPRAARTRGKLAGLQETVGK